ncbi:signal-regulatory protein beta-2-like isoform X2 [Lates calcarifer]|uniref:Signal-regulatory protein beta-2-like isoform X2 n=1 Tax=Lates calcarifer TaxID=8187 RepID=A0AAJ8DM59_LATCA|nr:signal-regulatory protein beta-2-like isoform X2 [Lates calcarifer]
MGNIACSSSNSLVPVITVQPGESVTFTCPLPNVEISGRQIHWYKQSAGNTPKIIATLRKTSKPDYSPEFLESRLEVTNDKSFVNLTIVRTIQEDEGMYHCEIMEWISHPLWRGTYLLIKGNSRRTSNYTVVKSPTASDPVTVQCSVLSESENKTCSGDHSVYWFRAGSDKSHPNIIYTDGNDCEKRSDSLKSCVYRFSKNVSSSDSGTYYCAVATCGEILFGKGTKVETKQTGSSEFTALMIVIVCLVISVIGNVVFICCRTPVCVKFKGKESASLQREHSNSSQPVLDITNGEYDQNYAVVHFSRGKVNRGRMKKEWTEESVYSHVKC